MNWALVGVLYAIGYALVVTALTTAHARVVVGNIALLLPPLVTVGVVVWRHRLWAGRQRLFWIAIASGAALWFAGQSVWAAEELARGHFYRPTIFADVEPGMRIAQEEIFGPTTALIPVDSFEDAVRAANSVRYGLSSSIFTQDVNTAFRAMRDLDTGITYINAGTIGAEVHLPFGGTKDTGNGHREAGQAALDVFTEWKSIYVDYSGKLQRAQIDNAAPG